MILNLIFKRYADKENLKKLMKYSKDTFANKSEINEKFYTKEQIDTMLELFELWPAGVIIPFAGTSVPTGYLLCNGAAVSRTDYANLFAAIGTLYGAGDGSTTFNLPDARDRVLQGASGKHSVGSYIAAGLPNITGTIAQGTACAAIQGVVGAFGVDGSTNHAAQVYDGNMFPAWINFNASRASTIYGASSTVQSPAIAINFIIKY